MRRGKASTALSTCPQSSTDAEIDGVMRSRGWGPRKATACRASASTGAKVPPFDWGTRAEKGRTRI